jgi:hypothetical protein
VSSAVLQKAIYAILDADVPLAALITGVYDHPPEDDAGISVSLGDFTRTDSGTKTDDIVEHVAQVNVWSSGLSFAAVGIVQGAIRDLLHRQTIATDTGAAVHCFETFSEVVPESDGELHGVQRFTILYQY